MIAPRRHDLVWVDPAAFGGGSGAIRAATDWARARLPFVQRASEPGRSDTALGWCRPLAAPPPRRIPLLVPPEAILARARPPRLADAIDAAPRGWGPQLRALVAEALEASLCLRVYGSLAWEWTTGLRYVWPGSDLDLLIEGVDRAPTGRVASVLEAMTSRSRPRIDGEVVLSSGDAIAWREFGRSRCEALLVRGVAGARLVRRATLEPSIAST